jgi:ribulose-5-phosphate 4-epimerase/fuculose-1-phosphate aldolase
VHVGLIFASTTNTSSNLDQSNAFNLGIATNTRNSSALMLVHAVSIYLMMWSLMRLSTHFSKIHPNAGARFRDEISLLTTFDHG